VEYVVSQGGEVLRKDDPAGPWVDAPTTSEGERRTVAALCVLAKHAPRLLERAEQDEYLEGTGLTPVGIGGISYVTIEGRGSRRQLTFPWGGEERTVAEGAVTEDPELNRKVLSLKSVLEPVKLGPITRPTPDWAPAWVSGELVGPFYSTGKVTVTYATGFKLPEPGVRELVNAGGELVRAKLVASEDPQTHALVKVALVEVGDKHAPFYVFESESQGHLMTLNQRETKPVRLLPNGIAIIDGHEIDPNGTPLTPVAGLNVPELVMAADALRCTLTGTPVPD
jgi:hypothetical protein